VCCAAWSHPTALAAALPSCSLPANPSPLTCSPPVQTCTPQRTDRHTRIRHDPNLPCWPCMFWFYEGRHGSLSSPPFPPWQVLLKVLPAAAGSRVAPRPPSSKPSPRPIQTDRLSQFLTKFSLSNSDSCDDAIRLDDPPLQHYQHPQQPSQYPPQVLQHFYRQPMRSALARQGKQTNFVLRLQPCTWKCVGT
jgi:hypothetical protein